MTSLFMAHALTLFLPFCSGLSERDIKPLNARCAADAGRKRRSSEALERGGELADEGAGDELLLSPSSFKPLRLISCWIEQESLTKRATAAIALPSGVGAGQFSSRVVDDGEHLEVKARWPEPLESSKLLHRKWLCAGGKAQMKEHHPAIVGFEDALKKLRSHSADGVSSTARIALPFPAQSHILDKNNLRWRGSGARIARVDLIAFVEEYAAVNDNKGFEEV
eukprot:Plantae.Rhodophyta-Hildenbrandia_rubra.ctg8188.p1 GENE.Plantae.Rhodophyta-Hildenbrandia_rubra.ctg8188~~Plantae.Rhodophyta-Hildenbrandia_rubra.ctg8188.p1  ORF type:complete len:223 (-),score=23.23 Plantae.Rhodophyta-Hildenbrandia_rubra.ctg8188:110-778(-)